MKYIRMLCFAAVLFVLTGAVFAAEPAESLTLDCTEQTLYTGNSVRVAATVAPKGASRRLNWSSSDPAVASVNSEGIVRGKTAGTCTVTCSTTDGSGVQAELAVTVLEKVQQVRIEEQPANLLLGNDPATGRKQLTLSVFPQDASIRTVTWTSDKPGIATVDENGVVTAVAAGSCVITAKTNDPGSRASGRCTVHVLAAVTELTLDKTELSVYLGETPKIRATVGPRTANDRRVKWTSSDTSVAGVNASGVIAPRKPGTVTVICTAEDGGGAQASCTVTVKAHAHSIKLSKTHESLVVGGSGTGAESRIYASVEPAGAEISTVNFTSSDPSVVTVDKDGNLKAFKKGTATITVRSDDPACKQNAKCSVTVGRAVDSVEISGASSSMNKGSSIRLTGTVLPKDASSKKLVWTSSDSSVLRVDGSGLVHAAGTGRAVVTATAEDGSRASDSVEISVIQQVTGVKLSATERVLMAGEATVLSASVSPKDATDPRITWRSSDRSVASVDQSGHITAVSEGSAKIYAEAEDGSGKYASMTVVVEPADPVKLDGVGVGVRSDSMVVLTFENVCAKKKVKEISLDYSLIGRKGNVLTGGTLVVKYPLTAGTKGTALCSLRSASGIAHYEFSISGVTFTDGTDYSIPAWARRVTTWKR